jgi:hypothetical protein
MPNPREFVVAFSPVLADTPVGLFAITRLGQSMHMQLEPVLGSAAAWLVIGGGCVILLMVVTVCLHAAYKKVYGTREEDPGDYPRYPSCLLGAAVIAVSVTIGLELAARLPAWAGETGSTLVVFEVFALGTFFTVLAVHLMNVIGLVIVMRRAWHCSGAAALVFYSMFSLVSLFLMAVGLNVLRFCQPDLMEHVLAFWS